MLEFLKKEANKAHTEKGAATYRATRSERLDLFATIGALRRRATRRSPTASSALIQKTRTWQ